MRNSDLKNLTRENQQRISQRLKGFLKANAIGVGIFFPALCYATFMWSQASIKSNAMKRSLDKAVFNAASAGCPAFTGPHYIVVSGANSREVRLQLGRIANDLDEFNDTLLGVEK